MKSKIILIAILLTAVLFACESVFNKGDDADNPACTYFLEKMLRSYLECILIPAQVTDFTYVTLTTHTACI